MINNQTKPSITPQMKVTELLNHYPQLEPVLLDMSPAFAKLKNPILRKTIAKVATLSQAALVGNIAIGKLINGLRNAAGIEESFEGVTLLSTGGDRPDWLMTDEIGETFDARPILKQGEHPLTAVFQKLNHLPDGRILELLTPFYPAPLIEKAQAQGYSVWSDKTEAELIKTYFIKEKQN